MILRGAYPVVLAVLAAVLVSLYPYLGGTGSCAAGQCPYAAAQSSGGASSGSVIACAGVVLATAVSMVPGFSALRGRRPAPVAQIPTQLHLSPESPPPRTF